MKNEASRNIDQYISTFPEITQKRLERVRTLIRKIVPKGEETISYGIPTVKFNGRYVIYFSGNKKHISIYPAPRDNPEFKKELAEYKGGKGTVQFPLDKPLPSDLIKRIAKFRVKRNKEETDKRK